MNRGLFLILALIMGCHPVPAPGLGGGSGELVQWEELLEASARKGALSQEIVKQALENPASPEVRKLAELLREEWDLQPDSEVLKKPRLVYSIKPDYSDLAEDALEGLQSPVVVLTGVVTAVGTVDDVEIALSSGIDEVDDRCWKAFRSWRYRPAIRDGSYVRGKVGATCHLNPT